VDGPRHPALVNEGGVDDDIPVLEGDLVHVLRLVVVHGPVAPGALGHPARGVRRGRLDLLGREGGGAVGSPGVAHTLAVPVVTGVPGALAGRHVALR